MSSKTSERQRDKYFSHTEVPSVQRTSSWTISKGFWQAIHRRLGMDRKHKVSTSPVTRNANKAVTVFSPCSPQWVGKGCFRHRCSEWQHLEQQPRSISWSLRHPTPSDSPQFLQQSITCAQRRVQRCVHSTVCKWPESGPPQDLQVIYSSTYTWRRGKSPPQILDSLIPLTPTHTGRLGRVRC